MNKKALLALPFLSLVASCAGTNPSLETYVKEIPVFASKDEGHVLHLSDIHWSIETNYAVEEAYIKKVIEQAKAFSGGTLDLIMITGDLFLTANQSTVQHLFNLLDSFDIPWGFTYGNHDKQGTYGPSYVIDEAMKRKNCVAQEVKDAVYGRSNYVVNLTDGTSTKWQVYSIDSNSLTATGPTYKYDVIHEDQIDWYEQEINFAKANNGGAVVSNLTFFHIPLFQWEYAYRVSKTDPSKYHHGGDMWDKVYSSAPDGLEGTRTYPGYKDTGLFKKAESLGATKGMFCGHDHSNSFYSVYGEDLITSNDILLAYALKGGHGLDYHTYAEGEEMAPGCNPGMDMIGGNVITIHKGGSFDATTDFFQLAVQY